MENKNLVSLNKLKRIAKEKGLDKYIKEYAYAHDGKHKYQIININNKKIKFGSLKYQDYLTFDKYIRDEKRRLFKLRFEKLYDNNKNNINKPIFWAWNLIW